MSDVGVLVSLDDSSVEQTKVVLDYTSRDFAAIRAQLIGLAKGIMPEWETAGEAADFGTLILELFAYMGDVMHFYIDRTASEAFLGTAQRRQSVLYIADMLGYTPIGQQAASVALYFSVDPEETQTEIKLVRGTRVHNEAENADDLIVFELDADITLHPGDIDKLVYATEGVMVNDVPMGPGTGSPNTEFVIPDKGVVYNTISVTTLEGFQVARWTYVSDLGLARPTQSVFTTYLDEQDLTHVVFGDNAAGRVPPVNAEMFVTYRFGKGAIANDLGAEAINTLVSSSTVDTSMVSVRNKESPVGGTDPETIDSMRFSIPRASNRLKQRAVTLADYADLAMQVPGVAKSVSYGTIYTAIHVRIAPQGGRANPEYMKRLCLDVEGYMRDKILVGSTVYAEPIDVDELWQDVWIRIAVHVQAAFNRGSVRSQVEQVVRQLLTFNTVDFGYRVTIGAVYRAALAVQGVEWAELLWLSTEPPPSEMVFFPELPQTPVATQQKAQEATDLLFQGVWGFDTDTSMGDPGSGDFRQGATEMAIHKIDNAGTNFLIELSALHIGDHILQYEVAHPEKWSSRIITAAVTVEGTVDPGFLGTEKLGSGTLGDPNADTWIRVTTTEVSTSVDPDTGQANPPAASADEEVLVRMEFIRYQPTPITPTADVINIDTPELLIPRIEPTQTVEPDPPFTGMTEEERTHDGMWVWAVGGMPNT